jgi:Na+-translocating ferredoxin:NAD+ oxidoreductase subunit G
MSDTAEQLGSVIRRHSLRLGLFALGTTVLLAIVNIATGERIAEQRQIAERAALEEVLPPTRHDNDLLADSFTLGPASADFAQIELLGLSVLRQAYIARQYGEVSGVILPAETAEGYSGTIVQLVGIDRDGKLTGVRVLQHNETPGLGDKIEPRKHPWIFSFDGRSLGNTDAVLWQVKKDGGEFDQFVGATITPRAVVGAVHRALQFFEANKAHLLQED